MKYSPTGLEGQTRKSINHQNKELVKSRNATVAMIAGCVFVMAMCVSVILSIVGTEDCEYEGEDRVCTKTSWYAFTFLPKARTELRNGERDGIHIEYSRGGDIVFAGSFEKGERKGIWQEYYSNGSPRFSGTYFNDQLTGSETWWYENGAIEWTVERHEGKRNGVEYWYHSNGKLRRVGEFEHGDKVGEFVVYGTDGDESFRKQYSKPAKKS